MRYNVIFSGQTSSNKKLSEKGILVGSIPFFLEEEMKQNDFNEKIEKFKSAIYALSSIVGEVDFLAADFLARYNFEITGQNTETAKESALKLGCEWMNVYEVEKSLKEIGVTHTENWEKGVLENKLFNSLRRITNSLYQNNIDGFKQLVDKTAFSRCSFLSEKINIENPNKALEKCREYIIEECSGVLLFRYKGYESLVYIQGKLNDPTFYLATKEFNFSEEKNIITEINKHKLKLITISKCILISQSNSKFTKNTNEKIFSTQAVKNSPSQVAFFNSRKQDYASNLNSSLLLKLATNNVAEILNNPDVPEKQKENLIVQLTQYLTSYKTQISTRLVNS